jgi:tripartite motif-containing protein 71
MMSMHRPSHPRAPRRLVIALIAMMATFLVAVPSASALPLYSRDYGIYATAEVSPVDVVRDSAGNWYVLDDGLACLKKYAPDRTTILRTYFTCGSVGKDDTHISRARGIGRDPSTGAIWIADTSAQRLLKLDVDTGAILVNTTLSNSAGGALNNPGDVAVDTNGNAYVIDLKNRIVKVSPTGQYITQWGTTGSGPGQINTPMSIEFSSVGGNAVYITDARNFRVDKFGLTGTFIASYGSNGTGNGRFTKDARGIAVDSNGVIYAADVGGDRVVRFAANGTPLTSLGDGKPYYRNGPLDIFYGARGLYVDGTTLAVCDMWNYRVLLWTLTGQSTGTMIGGTPPPWNGHLEPHGVALDANGNVYVSDYWHQWIQKFAPDGTLLAHWGIGRGDAPGTLNLPGGIAVDNTRQYLYIANREQRVVDRWNLSDGSFNARFAMPAGPADPKGWPRDVAVAESTGLVYAADEKNKQVVIFNSDGTVNKIITKYGTQSLGVPRSVAVGANGNLYVADGTNRMVHVYTGAGAYVMSFGVTDSPNGIDVANGEVYILSYRVREYTTAGVFVRSWGTTGTGDGQLKSPYVGIAVDPTGNVYIGDSGNHRVKEFNT